MVELNLGGYFRVTLLRVKVGRTWVVKLDNDMELDIASRNFRELP